MKKKYVSVIIFILGLILIDQAIKYVVVSNMKLNESIILISNFFKIEYIRNMGAAFGILGSNIIILILITLALIFFLLFDLIKGENSVIKRYAYMLIIGGAFGNLIDRVFRHYVVDFISFTLFGREMAIFNVADMFITFGVILVIIDLIKEGKNERNSSK